MRAVLCSAFTGPEDLGVSCPARAKGDGLRIFAGPLKRQSISQRFGSARGRNGYRSFSLRVALGSVEIHREFITAAARWMFAAKL